MKQLTYKGVWKKITSHFSEFMQRREGNEIHKVSSGTNKQALTQNSVSYETVFQSEGNRQILFVSQMNKN